MDIDHNVRVGSEHHRYVAALKRTSESLCLGTDLRSETCHVRTQSAVSLNHLVCMNIERSIHCGTKGRSW